MSVQVQIEDMYGASTTVVELCRDLQDPASLANGPQTSFWTVQEILACVDDLIHAALHDEAHRVLRTLTG